jgi:hypothetical protein
MLSCLFRVLKQSEIFFPLSPTSDEFILQLDNFNNFIILCVRSFYYNQYLFNFGTNVLYF